MKKTTVLFLALLFSISAFSQTVISGKVMSKDDGKPIASASVTVEEIGKNAILSYAITDAKGQYKVSFSSNDSKIQIKEKAFKRKTLLNE